MVLFCQTIITINKEIVLLVCKTETVAERFYWGLKSHQNSQGHSENSGG